MSKLLEMLQQRGVDTATTEALDASPLPADATKYGEGPNATVVCVVNRQRINEKDVSAYKAFVQKSGSTTGILIVAIPPSETVLGAVSSMSDILQIFHTAQLEYNPTKHRKVPKHRILSAEEVPKYLEKYNIVMDDVVGQMQKDHIRLNAENPPLPQIAMVHKEYLPVPHISSQDAIARWIGAKPGDVVEILRNSETAGGTPYYRICVANV
jgi:DNA-directed RNA polymerase I, II, and III subunit RPABC1